RGIETQGINLAADYLGKQFAEMGLKTKLYDGTPFQRFSITTSSKLGPADKNTLTFSTAQSKDYAKGQGKASEIKPFELKLGEDFTPLAAGSSAKFDLPVVFVGYGITAPDAKYDDYAGIDVKGKAVVILRHQPQQANPHSPLGPSPSRHSLFDTKIANAYEHGAAAILFCSSDYQVRSDRDELRRRIGKTIKQLEELALSEPAKKAAEKASEKDPEAELKRLSTTLLDQRKQYLNLLQHPDPLLDFHGAGDGGRGRDMPVFFCRRETIDKVLKPSLGKSLAEIEKQIDEKLQSHSFALPGCRVSGQVDMERRESPVRNIVGVMEGEGPLADETIVIGAHYDHLGYGGTGSAAPGSHDIHHGADDNGSGTVGLLQIARMLSSRDRPLPRRIVFILFSGEERGLLGSAYYIKHPLVPLDKTVAMLNLDMVGRLKDEKLIINGMATGKEFDQLVRRINVQHRFELIKKPEGFGPSDHLSFYAAKVPVMHFFTGTHTDYHRPSDTADKLNIAGIRRIASFVAEIATALAEAPSRPTYQETKAPPMSTGGTRPYFGSIPDYSDEGPGLKLQGVAPDGPASRGGLQAGDVIIRLGESRIGNIVDFDNALRKHKAGEEVQVVVRRGKVEKTLTVTLAPPK
ncbi:MAG: M28 family peptidase, partial [Planctomycetia bacterium]|nr:M28 family peptidase [Planctomycetia bacterium]